LHYAISPFAKSHDNKLLKLLWHSNLRVKKCRLTSLFSQSVGQFTPKWRSLARMCTGNREKPLPHILCSFTSSLCTCPASSASI